MAAYTRVSEFVYTGASTDTKPTSALIGASCQETDTGDIYYTLDGSTWTLTHRPSMSVAEIVRRVPGIGRTFYVNGGSDGPTDNAYNGLTPATPKQTITAALALCTSNYNDVIYVLNYGSNGRAAETWPIVVTKDQVHIIGVGHKANKWATVTATGTNKSAFSVTGQRVEIAGLEIGGTAAGTGAGILAGSLAGAWGLYVHDCWFGKADGAGTNGIVVPATFDAPFLRIEDCEFGDQLLGTAILMTGVATKHTIHNNVFRKCTKGIDIDGASAGGRITDNRFALDGNTAGDAIDLAAGVAGILIDGNVANAAGKADMAANPYVDVTGTANFWMRNYQGKTLAYPA